ncbi:MAG: helix-turn-helix transcriptional regulator [Armatimonadetes bacterium]|nr:helix-turn-helix transcriptional regulator [Armatimonadota bacterium]
MRYWRAFLGEPPQRMFLQWGDLPLGLKEWVQPSDTWRVILYDHDGLARINGRSYPYTKGQGLIFPPFASCAHAHVGPPSLVASAHFDFPPTQEKPVALPAQFSFSREWYDLLWNAGEHGMGGAERGKALVWHVLWTVSEPTSVLRTQTAIYDAEDMIRSELDQPLRVSELATRLGISQGTLLLWFQSEHGTTIRGFIRQARAREACRLLISTDLKVKQIAAQVGVPDLHQFNKLVRSHTGLSPRDYRNKAG